MTEVRTYLGLGSNQGDRLDRLRRAMEMLGDRGARPVRSSRVYETEPEGGPPQPDYLNSVLEVETELEPRALLDACLDVEADLGRVRGERWGPRVIDIDLQVPHPRMHERAFVMVPLLELVADPPLPGGRTVAGVRLGADALGGVRPFAPPLV
jgi:2-amino-4-hydroxy-6-hydroxymethyldihydropteridine diphosphokinase